MYPKPSLYSNYLKRAPNSDFSPHFKDVTKRITLDHINLAMNLCDKWDSFLDVGGGNGHYSTALAASFVSGTIVEVGAFDEHKWVVSTYPNIAIRNETFEAYSPKNTNIDFVLLADIFEHIPNIREFSSKLSAMQEAGGVVYILTPNPLTCAPAPLSELYFKKHPYGHIKHYSEKEIVAIMSDAGYEHMLTLYEERPLRQIAKRIIKGISRRSLAYEKHATYRALLPLIFIILLPFIRLADCLVYNSEKRSSPYNAISQGIIFKKIK